MELLESPFSDDSLEKHLRKHAYDQHFMSPDRPLASLSLSTLVGEEGEELVGEGGVAG